MVFAYRNCYEFGPLVFGRFIDQKTHCPHFSLPMFHPGIFRCFARRFFPFFWCVTLGSSFWYVGRGFSFWCIARGFSFLLMCHPGIFLSSDVSPRDLPVCHPFLLYCPRIFWLVWKKDLWRVTITLHTVLATKYYAHCKRGSDVWLVGR